MKKNGIIVFIILILTSCTITKKKEKPIVFVSILPQQYFVEQLVGDAVQIEVMVQPGFSPATYEPTPKQMKLLEQASLFFAIGVPFEKVWLPKIKSLNPTLKIIHTEQGIQKMPMHTFKEIFAEKKEHFHNEANEHHHHHDHREGVLDPHIWLSPTLVKTQSRTMTIALEKLLGRNLELSLKKWVEKLDEVDQHIKKELSAKKKFMVFHPSWGYFAKDYNLQMIPIEIQGKKPSSKQLETIIHYAEQEQIHTIFVQKQFSTQEANAISEAIKGIVISIDPLAYDYIANLIHIAQIMQKN